MHAPDPLCTYEDGSRSTIIPSELWTTAFQNEKYHLRFEIPTILITLYLFRRILYLRNCQVGKL